MFEPNHQIESPGKKHSFWRRVMPMTLVLAGSLLALIAAGFQESHGLKLAVSAVAAPLLVWALSKTLSRTDFSSPRLMNATARQLAWIRILVSLSAFILTVVDNLPIISSIPGEFRGSTQFFQVLNVLPGYNTLVSNPYLLATLQWTTATLLFLAMIGFMTRTALLLGGLGFFLMQAILRHYTYFFHSGLIPLYLLFLLALTPCAAAWSIDHWRSPAKPEPSRQSIAFAIYACLAVIALIYLLSALSKMRVSGLGWFRGESIQNKLIQDAMSPCFLDYQWKASLWLVQHDAPDFVYSIIGAFGVAVEFLYLTVLFSRTARIAMPILAFVMHVGILVFQNILFLDLLILQFIFLNADKLASFAGRFFGLRGPAIDLTAPPGNAKQRRAVPLTAVASMAIVIAGLLVVWVFRVNYYPVSDWHMYSQIKTKKPVYYYRMVATLEDGRSLPLSRRDYFPTRMPNEISFLTKAFREPWRNGSFAQFLSGYVERRDRELPSAPRISLIEVQQWRWNYAVDPRDRRFGWISRVYSYDAVARRAQPSPGFEE